MAEGLLVKMESGKCLVSRKFWRGKDLKTLVLKIVAGGLNRNAVIAADPSLVSIATVPINTLREKPKEPVSAVELENLLAQSAGKIFSRCRLEAAENLRVDDLDVVLVGSRVLDFRLDSRRVFNPLGFEGRRIQAALEFTFTSRAIFEAIKPFKNFFFTGVARSELKILEKIYPPPIGLLVLGAERSYFATRHEYDEINWQTASLIRAICNFLAVSPGMGEKLYAAYLAGDVSPAVARAMNRELRLLVQSLLAALSKLRPRGKVFLDAEIELPLTLPLRKRTFSIQKIDLREIMLKMGFGGNISFRWLAPLAEFLSDKSDSDVNRWLRRYLHWLGSPV